MSQKRALITGITGQDGSYLAELLLAKGYEVHGVIRRSSTFSTDRIDHLYQDPHELSARLFLHYGDLSDGASLRRVLKLSRPDEVYNLAAQSHVGISFHEPEFTADVDGLGVLRLLEAIRAYGDETGRMPRVYQAGTSEMFGASPPPQCETTPFHPRSPYACAKVYAFHQVVNHRESYGIFACNGILFNHESERRGETFVTRKITRAATRIALGLQDKLFLGNLDAIRDWGHAEDYVEAMWRMLQGSVPGDWVVATGSAYSVREFVERVFARLELPWEDRVVIDERYFRPAEVVHLHGDPQRVMEDLGWRPRVGIDELVARMVDHDLELARQEAMLKNAGYRFAPRGLAGV
ncbi:GDP-mannose 4,6-dehydratase [soil metagenome]